MSVENNQVIPGGKGGSRNYHAMSNFVKDTISGGSMQISDITSKLCILIRCYEIFILTDPPTNKTIDGEKSEKSAKKEAAKAQRVLTNTRIETDVTGTYGGRILGGNFPETLEEAQRHTETTGRQLGSPENLQAIAVEIDCIRNHIWA